jgi:hypothetical protein
MSKATNPPTLKRENKTVFAENEIVSDTKYKDSNETYSGSEDEESAKNLNSKKEKAKKEKSEAEVGESEVGARGRINEDIEYKDSNETYSGSEDVEKTKTPNSKKEKAKKEKSEAEVGESEVGAGGRIKHIKIQDHVQRMQRMSMLSRQIIEIDVAIKALVEQKHNVLSEIRDLLLEEQSVE